MTITVTVEIKDQGTVQINQVDYTLVDIITPRPELSQTYNIASDEWTGGYTSRSYWHCFRKLFGVPATRVVNGIVKLIGY